MLRYLLVATASILLFLHGFFPLPATIPKDATMVQGKIPKHNVSARFKNAVLIVIDALRFDFITDETMPFVSKTHKHRGCISKLKAETPTVTLPRIKALTTGKVPQFIDIILNLANHEALEDSIIHRIHAQNKNIVFYGDDTWLNVFPNYFIRSEGTTSFFVNDFKEVDDNVTRNMREELLKNDWDLMILHYLGLDHIGHVLGPKSPLISLKLQEMDAIISEIYNQYRDRDDFLIVITGDHGMRDSGGHGGSTYAETHVPLIILGGSCQSDFFYQTDFPANLAILLGFQIPATSLGQLKPGILGHLTVGEYLQVLKYNTFLLRQKLDLCEELFETANYFHDLFLLDKSSEHGNSAVEIYENCSRIISETLLKAVARQNGYSLILAIIGTMCVLFSILKNDMGNLEFVVIIGCSLTQFFIDEQNDLVPLLLIFITSILFIRISLNIHSLKLKHSFLLFVTILYPLSLTSSSFIEEEHQFWYFFSSSLILLLVLKTKDNFFQLFSILIGIRVIRMINQVGDKWASVPDLSDWLLEEQNNAYLQLVFILGLILVFLSLTTQSSNKLIQALDATTLCLIYSFRNVTENVFLGKILWVSIIFKTIFCYFGFCSGVNVWVLLSTLLLKPYNIILLPACIFASKILNRNVKVHIDLVLCHLWLGHLLFFAQGHDNSLASVDISVGYIGLSSYKPIIIVPVVFFHTYVFHILSNLLLFQSSVDRKFSFLIMLAFRLYSLVVVFIVNFINRQHLFIWSVFAPKIFVEAAHFLILMIQICCWMVYCLMNSCKGEPINK